MKKFILLSSISLLFVLTPALAATPVMPTPEIRQEQVAPAPAVSAEATKPAEPAAPTAPAETAAEPAKEKSSYAGTFWALLPPVLAILLALITKEVFSSLFVGIVLGSLFAADFSLLKTMDILIKDGLIEAVKGTAGIFIFLLILGMMVALIHRAGAAAAFGNWARKHVKGRRGAGFMTYLLGLLIFIDDYFNCLTVGSVMRPITDSKKLSRAKLAYIIDATAAPVCMIAPISSWAAAVSQYAQGTGNSGLKLFILAIPYNFYSLLTLIFIAILLIFKFDFGSMKKYEAAAAAGNDTSIQQESEAEAAAVPEHSKGRICDILIPVFLLIVISVYALLHVGGIGEGKNFIAAFSDTDATVGLPWGALLTLIVTIIYLLLRRVISFKDAMAALPKGFNAMMPAIFILTFATSLKNMTTLLEGREFIAAALSNAAPDLAQFLPAAIFVVATLLAFSTGTSWGTFGILIPIVVAIFPADTQLLYIGISACLAGAVCGDHCSPISDTTIMSSVGAGCEHIIHVSTQLPYALTVAVVSFVGYIVAGVLQNWYAAFPLTVLLMAGVLLFIKYFIIPRKAEPRS